ncbi:hypothetical protein DXG01_006994 [Tephrocybe rancida]|nr:hypothetical protein DXG01_006994 [Tephrocybe rancida]
MQILTTWLSHSKKKNCDVCKHPYSFTKVYAPNMPSSLPPVLLVKKLIQQTLFAILFGIRGIVVGVIWLAALPWATVWTWRMYFSMGESTMFQSSSVLSSAWWISGRERPPSNNSDESPFYYNIHPDPSLPQPTTVLGRLTSHPVWAALSADIFTGQIIASLIVLTFVAVFLLREWISQNARPGIFDDEEILPEEVPRAEPRPAPAAPQQPHPLEEALARRQAETLRALEALRAREGNGHVVGDERPHGRRLPNRKGKGRRGRKDRLDPDLRAAVRRKLLPADEEDEDVELDSEEERLKRKAFARRVHSARVAGARRKLAWRAMGQEPLARLPLQVDPTFQFTFAVNPPPTPPPAIPFTFDGVKWVPSSSAASSANATTPQANDPTLPPNDTTSHLNETASLENEPTTITDAELSSSSSSLNQRRPPLPASSVPGLGRSTSLSSSDEAEAESSSMATYRAPEELEAEAGPSQLPESFGTDVDGDDEGITEEDFAEYFEEPLTDNHPRPATPSEDETDREGDDDNWRIEVEEHHHHEDEDEEPEMEDFVFDAWEAAEGDRAEAGMPDGAAPANVNAAVPPGEQGAAQNPPLALELPIEPEEVEGNVEDDMEGAMEAIGMRGPIYGVLQNAALMIFVLDTAIGLGIWIPFTVGKTTALLSLDPPRFLQILHLPIRAIRIITDPFVDSVAFILMELLVPYYLRAAIRVAAVFSTGFLWFIGLFLGEKAMDSVVTGFIKFGSNIATLADSPMERILAWTVVPSSTPQETSQIPPFLSTQLNKVVDIAEPYFEVLGRNVRLTSEKSVETWKQLAVGEGPVDRAFAITLGYSVVGVLIAIYLNILTVGNARTAGRAVRSAIRQQLLVLKVATFIFIELISFPLSCGVVLDLCTVWLFPEANLTSRVVFFAHAPLTAVFYHWVAGTMFMYAFAMILAGARSIMRPGAMWFIKDPQDVNSHPIREILDRPTLTQLKKICISGVMYSCVVACVVGSVAGLLTLGSKSVMPFRWKNRSVLTLELNGGNWLIKRREPLSNVPVDLLFLHIVLPYTMHYFRPKKALKAASTVVWMILAKQLRLTSYFFTGRYPAEERSIRWPFFKFGNDGNYVADGTYRRVPATDNVVLPKDMQVTVAVMADGQPVDNAARDLMTKQNVEVQRAGGQLKDEFVVVYIPPNFRYRIFCFIALVWIIGAFALGIAVALPVMLGRRFFEMFTAKSVHDGYSLLVGFYLLWGFYIIGSSIDRLDRRQQRASGERHGQDLPIVVLKRAVVWVAKSLYMALCLGVLIPTLISFVIDLYIVLPVRFTLDPGMTPRIRVVDTWALGLIYVKIALHANRIHPPNRFSRGIHHIMHNGWTKSDPVQATREVIGPVAGGLLGMILFPGLVFRAIQYIFPNMPLDDKFIFMHIYPGIFMLAGLVRSSIILYSLLASWSQSVRDKEFLVEMRLRNHEPEKEGAKQQPPALGLGPRADGAAEQVERPVVEEDREEDDDDVWEEVIE